MKTPFVFNNLTRKEYYTSILKYWVSNKGESIQKMLSSLSKKYNLDPQKVIAFNSGRSALYVYLKEQNLKPDDTVVVIGYTCVVVTNAVKYVGAKIKYVDININTLNASFEDIEKKVSKDDKVIIIANNFGYEDKNISKIKSKYPNIRIVVDCAHGNLINIGKYIIKGADSEIYSFEYSKQITGGSGGLMVLGSMHESNEIKKNISLNQASEKYNTKIKKYITIFAHMHTINTEAKIKTIVFKGLQKLKLIASTSEYELKGNLPINYVAKMNNFSAFLINEQLKNIEAKNEIRDAIVNKYILHISQEFQIKEQTNDILVRFPILVRGKRDKIINKINSEFSVELGKWFDDPIYPKGSYRYMYQEGMCPVSENVASRIINLPININQKTCDDDLIRINQILENGD